MSEIKTVDIKGLLDTYEFPFTLPGSGKELLIKPITTGQMKRILAYEDENDPFKVEEALDKLISDCVVSEDFDIDDIYLQDRFALLIELRKVTKGDEYEFSWKCRECATSNVNTIVLSALPVKELNRKDNVLAINDKLQFEVDFPTRGDQKDAILRTNTKNLTFRERQVDVQTGTYANSVKKAHTPDGVLENIAFDDKVYILDNIPSHVFEQFTKWFSDNEFGIDFKQNVSCVGCRNEETIDIPLSSFFV